MRRSEKTFAAPMAFLMALGASSSAWPAGQSEFQEAFAQASDASKKAIEMKNQWTPATAALADAKKAADAGKFDEAIELAKRSEALSKAAIEQTREQEKAWRNAVIK